MIGSDDFEKRMSRYKIEQEEEWMKWAFEIPFIPFRAGWEVRIIPPYCAAMARFHVRTKDMGQKGQISVYLDVSDNLGYFGAPYWEVYPHHGDTYRCAMEDTDDLLKAIQEALDTYDKDEDSPTPEKVAAHLGVCKVCGTSYSWTVSDVGICGKCYG